MSKKAVENIAKALPFFFKNATQYLKSNFDQNGSEILENANGTTGVLIRLLAQPLIDNYFDNLSEKKLENFGLNTYLKASLIQANNSLIMVKDELDCSLDPDLVFNILEKSLLEELTLFNPEDILMIFQPKYHPAVEYVKNNYQRILNELGLSSDGVIEFTKHFNENIVALVEKEFGDDYAEHLKMTNDFRLKENETELLRDTVNLGRIGFKETENLKYESTYARWERVKNLREKEDEEQNLKEVEKEENKLYPIEKLIEEYFSNSSKNNLEQILFVVADFGKGKSVFMKHYAAELAKKYLNEDEGCFPIYFNLRNYKNYSSEPSLGVISDFLETKYSIKIDDKYYQNKRYVFLVDSLDESGELNKRAIDKVIASVKSIQGIDKTKFKTNRLIITSRPFDEGLNNHLTEHKPHTIKNKEGREIPYYISVYGFTKDQFNSWLFETLKTSTVLYPNEANGFAKQIIKGISKNRQIDIYDKLLQKGTLSPSELRRPIFAYMIYQLIINNVDFLAVGKIGVYLSFLNLLTKEAKHIHDINYRVNLNEEFEFRNVLQATASLWMYERQRGKQGMLKKADICRVLEGKKCGESDVDVLESYKESGVTDIQFLSHSYFGENNNILHFQHQSFAEILLAEYYLKVFIKYALDKDADLEEARVKLMLGEPTEQTIEFLRDMLGLLRETATNKITNNIIEKRKLLFPLMASLATEKNNRLFCYDIYYGWYNRNNIDENQAVYPSDSLENWCIDEMKLNKIISLAAFILNSKTNYLLMKADFGTALFDNEVLVSQNQNRSSLSPNIDKWLALLVGNNLHNTISKVADPKLFNRDYEINFNHLFEMIRFRNFVLNESAPIWGKALFLGINMEANNSELDLSHYNFDGINFSFSYLKSLKSWSANWSRVHLDYCVFSDASFTSCLFFGASIQDVIKIDQPFYMGNCQVTSSGVVLLDSLNTNDLVKVYDEDSICYEGPSFVSEIDMNGSDDMFFTIRGLIVYGLQKALFTIDDLKVKFLFQNKETEDEFIDKMDELKVYEVKESIETL